MTAHSSGTVGDLHLVPSCVAIAANPDYECKVNGKRLLYKIKYDMWAQFYIFLLPLPYD